MAFNEKKVKEKRRIYHSNNLYCSNVVKYLSLYCSSVLIEMDYKDIDDLLKIFITANRKNLLPARLTCYLKQISRQLDTCNSSVLASWLLGFPLTPIITNKGVNSYATVSYRKNW